MILPYQELPIPDDEGRIRLSSFYENRIPFLMFPYLSKIVYKPQHLKTPIFKNWQGVQVENILNNNGPGNFKEQLLKNEPWYHSYHAILPTLRRKHLFCLENDGVLTKTIPRLNRFNCYQVILVVLLCKIRLKFELLSIRFQQSFRDLQIYKPG